jgi:uncharacterized protein YbjT (DUF2867 family)
MIVVFGATGTVGRHVVAGLTGAGEKVRAFTRDPARAARGPQAEVVAGDLSEPAQVADALSGADAVFMVSAGPDALAHERTVAAACKHHRVPRVVKLSSVAAQPPVADPYGAAHAAGEEEFRRTGADWTALRSAAFMSNVFQWAASIQAGNTVYQPYAGIARAVIDPADVAAVAVACLTRDACKGEAVQLTGPDSLTAYQQAAAVTAALGRPLPLEVVDVPPEQALAGMTGAGLPRAFAAALLASLADPDPRRGGTPGPQVRQITGRDPATFQDWLARHVSDLLPG